MPRQFQYKRQQFQQDAVASVADVFEGVDFHPLLRQGAFKLSADGGAPAPEAAQPSATEYLLGNFQSVLEGNINKVQQRNRLQPAQQLIGQPYLALDTHMETGTGKTFTFINAIYELHKKHRLTHFVVIVPSIAIKEGIKKAFQTTAAYFARQYHQRIDVLEMQPAKGNRKGRKAPPSGVAGFIHGQHLTVLITTNHAFNRPGNIINQELEGFYAENARTPMAAIAAKHPVLIIDEPQRVEGKQTAQRINAFNPLFVLRYSATFREGQIKNLVYALDSYDAFHQKLVKGIGVTDYQTGTTDAAFLGLQRIFHKRGVLCAELAAADAKGKSVTVVAKAGGNNAEELFVKTGNPEYSGLHVTGIDAPQKLVRFSDATELKLGEFRGREAGNETLVAEVMLRDTIAKHLEKESALFARGIKCISLVFIDRVKDYRNYEAADAKGELQQLFERCYADGVQQFLQNSAPSPEYRAYLQRWQPADAHGGYFSADKKRNQAIDEGAAEMSNEGARKLQQEITELILRDKESALAPNNKLRFIFAHSALREGWDNPNVFQICKLRTGYSPTGLVQEVGRGLRICVNGELQRQDVQAIGGEFGALNRLDVFTLGNGEFIGRLQRELGERRSAQRAGLAVINEAALINEYGLRPREANKLLSALYAADALDDDGHLQNREAAAIVLSAAKLDAQRLLKQVPQTPVIVDGRAEGAKPRSYRASRTHYQQFKKLWELLHQKVIYRVQYSADFQAKVVAAINGMPGIAPIYLHRYHGVVVTEDGRFGGSPAQEEPARKTLTSDLPARAFLNQLAEKTGLPRNTVIAILQKVNPAKYAEIKNNPFAALAQLTDAINGVIYKNIVDNIRYLKLKGVRETHMILTDREFSAQQYLRLDELPVYAGNSLWREIAPYDSVDPERKISESALASPHITVFAKLPRAVKIPAPMYPNGINPDFAIVVRRANGDEQFYFVAEAKPSTDPDELRPEEKRRVAFMQQYFAGIDANINFSVVKSYAELLNLFQQQGALP